MSDEIKNDQVPAEETAHHECSHHGHGHHGHHHGRGHHCGHHGHGHGHHGFKHPFVMGHGTGFKAAGPMRETVSLLMPAIFQVGKGGSQEQVSAAVEVLNDARKKLYAILAQD